MSRQIVWQKATRIWDRPAGDRDARRREIAEVIRPVIRNVGIDKVSMRFIARETGCTTGVVTHYFADKDEIMSFAVARLFEELREAIESLRQMDDVLKASGFSVRGCCR
ncbi:MAG: TetR/AcrR family transcriptional regulator [Pseudomonadales bacterium]|nr:TetR/AcrR family transcriptional regulator [Pseudomonadales bacterium]MDP6471235.1 TetR/AcrR family transcriptional regulator [Pseudomonadales bacterium]MDP6825576.1 TetR/AcrR family transcriptional regulator [Pseudomonadales bacterium]MDP6972943.1 TetR/AcrR family transcriptional regulator [Pseudomonadales bacterium]